MRLHSHTVGSASKAALRLLLGVAKIPEGLTWGEPEKYWDPSQGGYRMARHAWKHIQPLGGNNEYKAVASFMKQQRTESPKAVMALKSNPTMPFAVAWNDTVLEFACPLCTRPIVVRSPSDCDKNFECPYCTSLGQEAPKMAVSTSAKKGWVLSVRGKAQPTVKLDCILSRGGREGTKGYNHFYVTPSGTKGGRFHWRGLGIAPDANKHVPACVWEPQ